MVVTLVQMNSKNDVKENLEKAYQFIKEGIKAKSDVIALPECFAYMVKEGVAFDFEKKLFDDIINRLSEIAKDGNTYIVAGTLPESIPNTEKYYNTSVVIGRKGNIVAKYRKIHLFDVTIDEKGLQESKYIESGNDITTFEIDNNLICGMTICYDVRFPELYRKLIDRKAKAIFVPSAFTMRTGKDHWEILLRARAIENQVYIFAPAQWGIHEKERESYGHSMIIDPWGVVVARKGEGEGILTFNIDIDYIEVIRKRIPSLLNRKLK